LLTPDRLFIITGNMLNQAQIKFVASLQHKKARKEHGVFVAEGEKIVRELLQSSFEVQGVYGTIQGLAELGFLLEKSRGVYEASDWDLQRISNLKSPNKVLAVVLRPLPSEPPCPTDGQMVIALDSLQDPGNMGTIIRTADWFGIRQVVCSPSTVDVFNPKVIQASMGSFLRVNTYYTDLQKYFTSLPDSVSILGAFPEGQNAFEEAVPHTGVIVIGNESAGISEHLLPWIKRRISITRNNLPKEQTGAESLNASVAAGILMLWATGNHLSRV